MTPKRFDLLETAPWRPMVVVAVAAVLLSSLACSKRPPRPVAKVADTWVGQEQWAIYRQAHPALTPALALHRLVNREVAFAELEATGKLNVREWKAFVAKSRREVLGRAYLQAQPGPGAFTEAQARVHFMSRQEERHVVHLLCKTQPEAEAALARVQKGEPFERVASACSKDPSVKQNRGDLGWIKRETVVKPFADAVFSAKTGTVFGPFQTEFGWHVAKVMEIRTPGEEVFIQNRSKVMAELEDLSLTMKRPPVLKALKDRYPLKVDQAVLEMDKTVDPAPGDESRIAGRVGSMTISLYELKQTMAEYLKSSGVSHGTGARLKEQFLGLMADDVRLALAGEKAGFHKRPEVMAQLWDKEREMALKYLSATYLDAYKVSEPEIQSHYNQFPSRFPGAGEVKLNLLVMDLEQNAVLANQEAQKNLPWQKLFDKYANKESTGNWNAGWVKISALEKVLPKEATQLMVKLQPGSLIGPLKGPEGFMLFKILDRKPGGVLPLELCKEEVKDDYLRERGSELVDRYIDGTLRGRFKVEEFPQNLGQESNARPNTDPTRSQS